MEKRKLCKKCGEEKPLGEMQKDKNYSDGYRNKCKQCGTKDRHSNKCAKGQVYFGEHYDIYPGKKLCIKCSQYFTLDKMVKDKNKKDGHKKCCLKCQLEYANTRYKENEEYRLECIQKSRDNYKENKEEILKQTKEYRDRPEIKERHKKKSKEYWERNREKLCAQKRKRSREHPEVHKNWRQSEKGKISTNISNARRRQFKRGAKSFGEITYDEFQNIIEQQFNECNICSLPFVGSTPTIDHIIPISRGGLLVKENVQALCRSCNSSKGTKTMKEYTEWRKNNE